MQSKALLISLVYLLSLTIVIGQKNYHVWPYGASAGTPTFPNLRCLMDFRGDTVTTYPSGNLINIRGTVASVCDSFGNLLVYTNGHFIADGQHQIIPNGSGLNPSIYFNPTYQNYDCLNCHMMVNWGDSIITLYHMGMQDFPDLPGIFNYLYRTDIILSDSGYYEVVNKNVIVGEGRYEQFNLVKQGNGKEYWLIQPILQKDSFNFYHVSADTIYLHHQQRIGPQYSQGWPCYAPGTHSVSPDGRQYVRMNNACSLWLYDLDRCEGILSNPREVPLPEYPMYPGAGTEFSSNSRYLYFTSGTEVYQVDTEAEVLVSDTVAVFDGFKDPFSTTFFIPSLMPDGRIYITSTNGVKSMHVIEHPDSAGLACYVNQHSFPLAGFIAAGFLRYPNVWLGPSDCDTSTVITTVSSPLRGVRAHPLPASVEVQLIIDGAEGHTEPWPIHIYDMQGREVYRGRFPSWAYIHRLDVSAWPPGMYIYQVSDGREVIAVGKLMVE